MPKMDGVAACLHAGPNRCDSMSEMGYYDSYTEKPRKRLPLGGRIVSMAHLHKHEDSTKEGVHWKCSQCGWESVHMYFGEASSLSICAQMNIAGAVIAG